MIEEGIELLALLLAQPDPQKANHDLWKALEQYCLENDMYPGLYCPYVPLQMASNATVSTSKVQFKTRYNQEK